MKMKRITCHNIYQECYLDAMANDIGCCTVVPVVNQVYDISAPDVNVIDKISNSVYEIYTIHDLVQYINNEYK